jgi:hypothetical protein
LGGVAAEPPKVKECQQLRSSESAIHDFKQQLRPSAQRLTGFSQQGSAGHEDRPISTLREVEGDPSAAVGAHLSFSPHLHWRSTFGQRHLCLQPNASQRRQQYHTAGDQRAGH